MSNLINPLMKKVLGETQTLHAGCSNAEPKIFAPPQTPFLVVQDGTASVRIRYALRLLGCRFY